MGRKGLFSSAAAGGSLIAASLLLVVVVSAMIGLRGFRSAREAPAQSVVLKATESDGREAGTAAKPAPVVIGSGTRRAARTPARAKRSARRSGRRGSRAGGRRGASISAPARNGLPAPARKRRPASAPAAKPAPATTQAPAQAPEQKAPPATPVEEVIDGVTGGVDKAVKNPSESIGDVLLDVRDALP